MYTRWYDITFCHLFIQQYFVYNYYITHRLDGQACLLHFHQPVRRRCGFCNSGGYTQTAEQPCNVDYWTAIWPLLTDQNRPPDLLETFTGMILPLTQNGCKLHPSPLPRVAGSGLQFTCFTHITYPTPRLPLAGFESINTGNDVGGSFDVTCGFCGR